MEITSYLTECIINKTPVIFLKYGDGEEIASRGSQGCNCDRDVYNETLKNGIIESFKYMVDVAENAYIAVWPFNNSIDYWRQFVEKPIRVVDYCSIIMAGENLENKVNLLKSIKESSLKKIYVCNPLMKRAKILLDIDHMVHVPLNNWVENGMSNIIGEITSILSPDETFIVLTSAGMGAKILISELVKRFPKNIYLDVGSALDQVCTKKKSRGYEPTYEKSIENLRELIPSDWDAPEYDYIYHEAYYNIGYHVS